MFRIDDGECEMMRSIVFRYFIFCVIGVIPTALAGYGVEDWQWWATCFPMWIGVFLHGYEAENCQNEKAKRRVK